jgi:hypothetical protein
MLYISVIKEEHLDTVDLIETEHRKIDPTPMVQAMKSESITPEELFTNKQKSERGELLFVQLPDCLPGSPVSYGKEEEKKQVSYFLGGEVEISLK